MRILHPTPDRARRGAALLLSFLVLIVILMICYQVNRTVTRSQIETRRNNTLTTMEQAIESVLLQIEEDLKADAEGDAGGTDAEGMPAGLDGGGLDGGGLDGAEGGEESSDPVDSKMDDWASPDTVHINEQAMRVLIVDEDSKYNIINLLQPDEEEAEQALAIVTRILDNCREDTEVDIDDNDAAEMARVMLAHLTERKNSLLPMEERLSDPQDENDERMRMPTSLREFVVLEPFEEHHFEDFFDAEGNRVHSIEWFLTCFTSVGTGASNNSGGGYAVNVNTAPLAVLISLFDPREVDPRLWDEVVEYRNEEEDRSDEDDDIEPMLDEFGNEVLPLKFFDNLGELEELRNYEGLEAVQKSMIERRLTTQSQVFSVYVVARQSTRAENNQILEFQSAEERERYERDGTHLVKTVRSILWRQSSGESASIVPLIRWEVLSFAPLEVLDFPERRDG